MRKIGIMTFQRAVNYGANLQAYALLKTLQKNGVDAQLIDYRCENIESLYRPFSLKRCASMSSKIKKLIKCVQSAQKRRRFDEFSDKYFDLSPTCKNKNELKEVTKKYDAIISGSDQVFNIEETGGDFSYYLDFAAEHQKKYAYAASFGSAAVINGYKEEVSDLLDKFDEITVRETSALDIIKGNSNKTATMALDPTFLLDKSEWEKISKEPKNAAKKFVLVYMMAGSDAVLEKAKECAKKNNCEVVILNPTLKQQVKNRNLKLYTTSSPEEFVWLFSNAQAVVTNSFHGLAFSLIFEKDFYIELTNKEKASRMSDLLGQIELNDRIMPCDNVSGIDWEKVKGKIGELKKNSIDYLLKIKEEVNNIE